MSITQKGLAPPPPKPISEQAGFWDARLRSPACTDADRASFAAWRDADPAHRAEFEKLQSLLAALNAGAGRADVRGLRESVVTTVGRRRSRRIWTAAACLAVVVGGVTMRAWHVQVGESDARVERYSTQIGQRSTVTLRDGSVLELNAASRLEVRFSEQRRSVQLLTGQAVFRVAKDSLRPFVVRAANRDIVAVGTEFDVRLDARSVQVTLLEGKVNVERSDGPGPAQQSLLPGQQLTAVLDASATSTTLENPVPEVMIRAVNVAQVTGWRDGRVFIADLSLAEAVAEMNRYSPKQIVVEDAALAAERVNGMFRAGDQDAFVDALQNYFPITASRRDDSQIVLAPRR